MKTKKMKRYIVDVLEIHTEGVYAKSAKDAVKKVNEGRGEIASEVFDRWACEKGVRLVEEPNG